MYFSSFLIILFRCEESLITFHLSLIIFIYQFQLLIEQLPERFNIACVVVGGNKSV
jgi:hypothetical protein